MGTITLHRPAQRNAVGDGMREELADAYRRLDADDAVRVLVLTGTPPAVCAPALARFVCVHPRSPRVFVHKSLAGDGRMRRARWFIRRVEWAAAVAVTPRG